MLKLNRVTSSLFYLMLFTPFLSYITYGLLGLPIITYYFKVIFCFYGMFILIKKWPAIKIDAILYFYIGYTIYILVWSFFNGYFEAKGLINSRNLEYLSTISILFVVYNTKFSSLFIKRTILIFKVTVVVAALASLIQVFNYSFLDAGPIRYINEIGDTLQGNIYLDRRSSIFGFMDPNELGLSYIPLLSLLVGILLYNRNKEYLYFLILGGISSFLSNNRYVMIAFLIIGMQILVFQKIKFKGIIKYFLLSFVVLLVLYQLLKYLGYNLNDWYNERLFAEGSLKETTRYKAISNFITFFPKAPFFGVGIHMTKEIKEASNALGSSQIHVGYLAHLVSFGLVGSYLLFGFWISLAKKLYETAKLTNYWGSLFAFLTYLWAQATLVNYSIFFYGLIFALIFDKYFMDCHQYNILLQE